LLDISHNHFWGEIPLAITKLVKLNTGAGAYTDIGHNHLTSKNTTVRAFLSKKDPDWEKTQTPINPAPVIQGLNPPSVLTGHPDLILQVRGRSMMNGAVVYWDGIEMPTTYVNNWTLEIVVPAAFMETEGEAVLTAKNPWPTLGPGAGYKFYISDLFPADGSTVLTRRPLFRWPATEGAERYQLQLSTAGNFSTLLMTVTSPTNELTLPRDLPLNRIIYWRVRPMVDGVYQGWSARHQFRSARPPTTPALSSPANSALTTNYKPRLVWQISSLPSGTVFEKYELQIATDPLFEFETIVLNEFVTNRSRPNYTVGEGVLQPNTRYFWRVRAFNTIAHYSNWSAVRSIRAAMLPPVLVEPVQGSTALTPRPLMKWEPVDGATAYQIQFSLYSNFSELLQSGRTSGVEYTPTRNLPQNRIIQWRVRAIGPNGPSLWQRGSFRSANPPSTPALVAPVNNRLLTSYTPTLTWKVSSLPSGTTFSHYILQVSTSREFPPGPETKEYPPITDRRVTSQVLDELTPNTRYFWRMQSWNTAGQYSTWSAIRNFRTAMLPVTDLSLDTTLTPRPTFTWTPPVIAGAGPPPTSYTIQFSLSPTFGTLITSGTPKTAEFTPNIDLPRNRAIYWRVRANGEFGPTLWTGPSSFLSANPPSTPSLQAPANNSLNTDYQPLLRWSVSSLPSGTVFRHYQLQIATNSSFTEGLKERYTTQSDIREAYYQVLLADDLQPNMRYFWRVRAYNEDDHYSTWSAVRSFRAAMLPPVLHPGVSNQHTRRPTFTWAAVDGASYYTIQLSLRENFSELLASASPAGTTWNSSVTLPQNRTIYWRVRAFGPNGPSLWSEVSSFLSANPPSTPTLVSPANGAVLKTTPGNLDWSNSTVPAGTTFARYEVQLATNTSFTVGLLEFSAGIGDRLESHLDWTEIVPPLQSKTRYYWRVRALNEDGQVSLWSTRWSFTTP